MAKVKAVVLKNKVGKDGTTNIKIRLTHLSTAVDFRTPWYIPPKYMGSDGIVGSKYPNSSSLNIAIGAMLVQYNRIIDDIGADVDNMDIKTLSGKLMRNESGGASFTRYANQRIKELKQEGRMSYADTYQAMMNHLQFFMLKDEILFREITFDMIQRLERYLSLKGCKVNTIRIYLNNIRAIYNHACEREIYKEGTSPFKKFKVKQARPAKRAIDILEIQKLMVKPYQRAQQRSVDIFMLIFYLAGINLKDLLYLKQSNMEDGYLSYKRLKLADKQEIDLRIKIVPEAAEIIEIYRGKKYLLNFLDKDDSYLHYKNFLKQTNIRLRMAAAYSGVKHHLSTYVARHSWATHALSIGIPKSDVDLSLGHDLNSMTDRYVDYTKMFKRIDEANRKVIELLSAT